ncbi:TPA: replication protein RepB [Clostridium perfringens]|uniref:Replication protein RepB n=1 Tax=Clostridium perfringens TaxID=1502 RepID=A0A8H9R2H2_CLOPF|nr:replication protein RepB [Clostridium perfringens]
MVVDKTKVKARNFAFIIYPESIPDDWQERLIKLGIPMAVSPLHDSDEIERNAKKLSEDEKLIFKNGGKVYKKPHYHVLYVARNPVTPESVRLKIKRALGVQSVSHVEIVDCVENYFLYLTHESEDAVRKNKHKYDKKDIIELNGFDIDRYVTLDESQKRELKNMLLGIIRKHHLVNVVDLMAFIEVSGEQFGISNINDVHDVVSANSSAFRLWFEGNYQCGWRAKYATTFDHETGEIKIGLAEKAEMESAKDE